MLADRLLAGASPERVAALLDAACDGAADAPEFARARTVAQYAGQGLRELAAALNDPDDAAELLRCLGASWLELRCAWERYNQTVNYQAVRGGDEAAIRAVAACAGVTSGVLSWIEELLPADELELLSAHTLALLERIRDEVAPAATAERPA